MKKKIAIIGLGYVGLPLVIEFQKKFEIIGYDISSKRVSPPKLTVILCALNIYIFWIAKISFKSINR